MKHRYLLITLLVFILCSSCGIEKRLYRPGFYVPGKAQSTLVPKEDSFNVKNEEQSQTLPDTSSLPQRAIINDESATTIIHPSVRSMSSLVYVKDVVDTKPHLEPRHKKNISENRIRVPKGPGDGVWLVALCMAVLGLLIILLGVALATAAPSLATVLFVIGLVMLLLGVGIGGAGSGAFFELLFGILGAL